MTVINADVSTADKMAAMMQSDETSLKMMTSLKNAGITGRNGGIG